MARKPPRVHCELGPVLVNRTAVYKMCRAIPGQLQQRGFRVSCSALLARVAAQDAEPKTWWNQWLFRKSQEWLHWASTKPEIFCKTRFATAPVPRWRAGGVSLFLDPLYTVFYGSPGNGVVIVYDITTVSDPGWHGAGVTRLYNLAFELMAQSRCHIVASCQNTADQMRVNWGIAPSRITVLPLGLFSFPMPAPQEAHSKAKPFLLFVGNLEPRKNVPGLIRAYAESQLFATRGIRLRIIGSLPPEDHPVLALARATPGVDVLGFVSDEEVAAAYEQCLAFIYPSFCEGFGLPLLEAMHRGCVCLSTIMGASPEIAQDAALYVNPYSPSEIAQGLREIVELSPAERSRLSERAKELARAFTWPKFYDGLADVLQYQAAA
ncbi:MAG TPA: glycosyltransferase family 1 protein [Gemmataceae bacterium]|nr:glycosyltransferase family 1 protein [Gemmataceae bacterium]